MLRAERYIGGLVFRDDKDLIATRDARRAFDDDPVLRAVVVHLQAQARARLDHDALHLKARTDVDALIPAPGPIDSQVLVHLRALLGL